MSGLYSELSRRNVIRVGIAYLVSAWVIIQVVDVLYPILQLPEWTPRLAFIILAIGFVPALIFAWAFELTPDGIKRESEVERDDSITSQTGKRLNGAIIAILVIAVALLLVDRQRMGGDGIEADTPTGPVSIAVLPFANMSSDEDFFADGISEEILNALATVDDLKVAGRTSSFAFKGRNEDLRMIGDTLGVEHILEGSVRRDGATVRITAQLIKASDGFHLWSRTYDREIESVFEVQDEIARDILGQLSESLLGSVESLPTSAKTTPEVYDLYLRARQRMYSRERPAIALAVEELDKAIELDPDYAPAYAAMGTAILFQLSSQYGDLSVEESNRRAKRFLDVALELDPANADAIAAVGLMLQREPGTLQESIEKLTQSLEINPGNIDAQNWLLMSLAATGDMKSLLDSTRDIAERDPLYRPAFNNGHTLLLAFGKKDEANQWVARQRAFSPDSPAVLFATAASFGIQGKFGEAVKAMQGRQVDSGQQRGLIEFAKLQNGQLEELTESVIPSMRALALYYLGREDEAFAFARQVASAGDDTAILNLMYSAELYQDYVDYVEERWPSIEAFAAEDRYNYFGIGQIVELAASYKAIGDKEALETSTAIAQQRLDLLEAQGLDNLGISQARVVIHGLRSEHESFIEELEKAIEQGYTNVRGISFFSPLVDPILDDPRIQAMDAEMLDRVNSNRAVLGLPPMERDTGT